MVWYVFYCTLHSYLLGALTSDAKISCVPACAMTFYLRSLTTAQQQMQSYRYLCILYASTVCSKGRASKKFLVCFLWVGPQHLGSKTFSIFQLPYKNLYLMMSFFANFPVQWSYWLLPLLFCHQPIKKLWNIYMALQSIGRSQVYSA